MANLANLPRRYYKRTSPVRIPAFKQTAPKTSTLSFGQAVVRRTYWLTKGKGMVQDFVNVARGTHMRATMGAWQHYREQGRLNDEVAIIVDGSVNRSPKLVKLFGQIIIQEPQSLREMYQAVAFAITTWQAAASRRILSGDYIMNLHVFANNSLHVDHTLFMSETTGWDKLDSVFTQLQDPPFFTIINTMPYAAKEERNTLPTGMAYHTWKQTRERFGDRFAVRFRYYTADKVDIGSFQVTNKPHKKQTVPKDGGFLSFPSINIGQPGAFNSGASPVIIRAARKVV
jgi:hypothetical protein